MNKHATVIYPGTFDPITYGHIDIIKRCFTCFDKVIIAIATNETKKPLFSVKERKKMVEESVKGIGDIEVDCFSGLLVDYAKSKNIKNIIRGLRALSDFEFEFQMVLTNRKLWKEMETIFMMPNEEFSYISSRAIKEICALGGDVSHFVTPSVEKKLKEKLLKK